MKTNYSHWLLYATAVVFAALTFLLALLNMLVNDEGVDIFAFVLAILALGGNVAMLANYLKKSSKSCFIFSVMVWLMSGFVLSVPLAEFITYEKTTLSWTVMIVSGLLFLLDWIISADESKRETEEYIAKMHRETEERIANMKKQSDAFIAQMHKETEQMIARMNKESEEFIKTLKSSQ